ncbi:MAG TPA: nitroreductase family protein, partial [Aquihabitans sp.]|nr:nitroreductase family protein [Aquihabitans sp.]
AGAEDAKVAKLRRKYLRSPTVLLVWVERDDADEVRRREDRDAVAAAVQNLLLAATAEGLGSYWGTVADPLVPAVRSVAGVGDGHDLVALVYLGWPTGSVPPPERPSPPVTRLS